LWIDLLCIIQDDADNWSNEASMIEAIFSQAHLVIGATASANCNEGFLRPPAKPLRIDSKVLSGKPLTMYARKAEPHDDYSRRFRTQDLPLFQRAWW
ncbi:hypothetical protein EK21DRAFT_80804, partial [Setomelanomma holmii]